MADRPLPPKRQRFVEEYLIDSNGTQAAIRAGYARNSANEQAAQLLADLSVRAAVDAARAEVSQRLRVTTEDVARTAWDIASSDETPPAARVSALALLGKYTGGFTDRVEHSGNVGVTVERRTPALDD